MNNHLEWSEAKQKAEDYQKRKKLIEHELKETISLARIEVQDYMNDNPDFTYKDLESILLGYGLEMDYIHDMI